MRIIYNGVVQTVLHFILLYIRYTKTYSTKGLRHKCPPIPCNMGGKAGGELEPQHNDVRVGHVTPLILIHHHLPRRPHASTQAWRLVNVSFYLMFYLLWHQIP